MNRINLHVIDTSATQAPPHAPELAARSDRLIDAHGRTISDLRLSITDRCNYRCVYCMDPDFRYMPKRALLKQQEYVTIARVCARAGVRKLRITGGEPTLYPELIALLEELGRLSFQDIAMTTNGSLMTASSAQAWHQAGLNRITLSLDSLRTDRVQKITRTAATPEAVICAIHSARQAGLDPIKVNAVIMRGVNDDELPDYADFARQHDVQVRLIEFMPLDSSRAWSRQTVVSADEMLEKIGARHELVPAGRDDPSGTALNFRFADGSPGQIGIIASVTRAFCGACSRLRITADGKIRPCLFSHDEWDMRPLLREGASDDDLLRFLVDAVWTKQAGHGIGNDAFIQPARTMSAIGG